jgi:hypothetical protein
MSLSPRKEHHAAGPIAPLPLKQKKREKVPASHPGGAVCHGSTNIGQPQIAFRQPPMAVGESQFYRLNLRS